MSVWDITAIYFCELRTASSSNTSTTSLSDMLCLRQVWQDAVDAFGGRFGEMIHRSVSKICENDNFDTSKHTTEQDNQNAFKARESAEARSEEEG